MEEDQAIQEAITHYIKSEVDRFLQTEKFNEYALIKFDNKLASDIQSRDRNEWASITAECKLVD